MEGEWAIWAVFNVPAVNLPVSSWARSTRPTLHEVIPAGQRPMRCSSEAGLAHHLCRCSGNPLARPYVAIRGAVSGPNDQRRWSSMRSDESRAVHEVDRYPAFMGPFIRGPFMGR
jgi:hypothetical protein